jgi:hypothetical protein
MLKIINRTHHVCHSCTHHHHWHLSTGPFVRHISALFVVSRSSHQYLRSTRGPLMLQNDAFSSLKPPATVEKNRKCTNLTRLGRDLLEKLIVAQLMKFFSFITCDSPLSCSQQLTSGPYPEPDESNPRPDIPSL